MNGSASSIYQYERQGAENSPLPAGRPVLRHMPITALGNHWGVRLSDKGRLEIVPCAAGLVYYHVVIAALLLQGPPTQQQSPHQAPANGDTHQVDSLSTLASLPLARIPSYRLPALVAKPWPLKLSSKIWQHCLSGGDSHACMYNATFSANSQGILDALSAGNAEQPFQLLTFMRPHSEVC